LTALSHSLKVIIQIAEPDQQTRPPVNNRITIQRISQHVSQNVRDASIYLFRFVGFCGSLRSRLSEELHAHFSILQADPAARLILAPPLLPEPGTVTTGVESDILLQDLMRSQLNNEHSLSVSELIEIINSAYDSRGRLVVEDTVQYSSKAIAIVTVKYERQLRPAMMSR
jgi:hypothetical protein